MKRQTGFTLIELMVVLAIVAILAAIALPTFAEQLRKSRRTDAIRGLADMQLAQERWRANHIAYGAGTDITLPTSDYYTFAITASSNTATGYTATATRKSGTAQAADRCGTYTLQMASGVVTKNAAASNCF